MNTSAEQPSEIVFDDDHRFPFPAEGSEFPVYKYGTGPGILILHELNGMTREFVRLASLVMDAGYTVYLPLFFGSPNESSDTLAFLDTLKLCIRHELECFATDKSSHLTHWLRALCKRISAESGGKGVGVIGMCLTGGLILSTLIEPSVAAAVVSQPALPFHQLPLIGGPSEPARRAALGLSPEEVPLIQARAKQIPVLGYRFKTDTICPPERFHRLAELLGSSCTLTEIPTGKDPWKIPDKSHAVFTKAFVDEPGHPTRVALDHVLATFAARLKT